MCEIYYKIYYVQNHGCMCEMMALKTLGIPEDLATVLSNLGLNKLGFPVWKLQKRRDGYSVNI